PGAGGGKPGAAPRPNGTPYSLLLTPYSLLLTPYSLLLTPYSLLLTPYSLLLTPYALLLPPYSFLLPPPRTPHLESSPPVPDPASRQPPAPPSVPGRSRSRMAES